MTGIDFAMTALFVTIFVDQWREAKSHLPAIVGLCSAAVCLLIFGGSNFILPSLIITVGILMALQAVWRQSERKGGSVMTRERALLIILTVAACTLITRLIPFVLFGGKRQVPKGGGVPGADPACRPSWPRWWYTA